MQTRDLLAKVRKIEIKTRKIVDELTGGAYHSVFKGRGIEFSEVRPYMEGDDVRDIDWNVTARTGSPFIKKYVEERELTVILAVDISASAAFGSAGETKREKMAEAAALLTFSAIRNNDKVGLLLFSDRTELYLPPRSGRIHALRIIRELLGCEAKGKGTDLNGVLETLIRIQKKKAVIFLISDFLCSQDYSKPLKILSRRHDLAAFRIYDPVEQALPGPCPGLELEDAETGELLFWPGSGKESVERYADTVFAMEQSLKELCRKAKTDLIQLSGKDDLVKSLMQFFRERKGRGCSAGV